MLENEDVGAIKEGDVGVVCKDLKKKRTLEARRDQKRDHFAQKVLKGLPRAERTIVSSLSMTPDGLIVTCISNYRKKWSQMSRNTNI